MYDVNEAERLHEKASKTWAYEDIKAYIDYRYKEQIKSDNYPKDLSDNDYCLLFEMLDADWFWQVPDTKCADSDWVKNELIDYSTYLYHKEEGYSI